MAVPAGAANRYRMLRDGVLRPLRACEEMTSDPKKAVMLAKASIQRHRNVFKNNKHGPWPSPG